MSRKLEIARWHASFLPELATDPPEIGELPPIPLQAHFEAAGRAVASIPDQLASGICEALADTLPSLPKPTYAYLHTTSKKLPAGSELQIELENFIVDPRYCDLRSWRNRATHRFDKKAMLDGIWSVAIPDDCASPVPQRDLPGYIEIMIDFGQSILERAPPLDELVTQLIDFPSE